MNTCPTAHDRRSLVLIFPECLFLVPSLKKMKGPPITVYVTGQHYVTITMTRSASNECDFENPKFE